MAPDSLHAVYAARPSDALNAIRTPDPITVKSNQRKIAQP